MKKLFILFGACLLAVVPPLAADEEDDFFDDGAIEVEAAATETNVDEALEKESLSLSGNIEAVGSYTLTRDFLWGNTDIDDNALAYYLTGDFLIDARLRRGFRAFTDINIGYSNVGLPTYHYFTQIPTMAPLIVSEDQDMLIGVKELFVDFNISNVVYFRVGKQVLTWGRGYLWNPTDLINVQQKSFLNMDALREGTFGLRTDFIFDRAFSVYTFVQFQDAEDFSDMAVAGKVETLIGATEMSLSAWWRGGEFPVFGYDISAPLFWDLDFRGEIAVSWGDNRDKMRTDGTVYSIRDRLVPRFCVGLSRSFDFQDVENRIMVNAEFYYNDSGYDDNMFESLSGLTLINFYSEYYDANNYGRFYGALFVTINKFLISQFTLTLSGMGNFSDMSFMAVAELAYAPVYNFTMSFRLLSFLGENYREYTVAPEISGTSVLLGNNLIGAGISCSVKF
jgi:hypothetical protein